MIANAVPHRKNPTELFYYYRTVRRVESVGNGRGETETDSSSKTFVRVAVVFTRRTIPRLSWLEGRNKNLVDRGEELAGKGVTGLVRCVFANLQAATVYRIDAHHFHPFHFSFVSLPFLDLDAPFHRYRCSLFVPTSFHRLNWFSTAHWFLVDATRLDEWPNHL